MAKSFLKLMGVSLVVLTAASVTASAEEVWSVHGGQTFFGVNTEEVGAAGIDIVFDADGSEGIAPANLLPVKSGELTVTLDGGVPVAFEGLVQHDVTLILQSDDHSVRLDQVAVRFGTTDGENHIGVAFSAHSIKEIALQAQDTKVGFDRPGGMMFIEAAGLAVSESLAAELGRPELVGLSIGAFRAQVAVEQISGDESQDDEGEVAGGNNGTNCWNPGEPQIGPDVIVGVLADISNYNSTGGIEAFAVGTVSCNIGSANLLWIANNNQHPVIGQSMFRLKNGRFEHIGQSWLKHGFTALTLNDCGCGCSGQGGAVLGIGCSDPYTGGLNGEQTGLGPKSQVNAHSGFFVYPHDTSTGNSIYKRLQVRISDLDPNQNGGGDYFVEGQYVAPDDSNAGNQDNNVSYRKINVSGNGNNWNASMTSTTQREQPAIRAWKDTDSSVQEVDIRVPNEGLMILAAKVTELDNGMWHYEYALQNVNSDRSSGSFSVPVPSGTIVSNMDFHDVDYHSGEPYGLANWTSSVAAGQLTWTTDTYQTNPNANALRWGTLYNFRFDANAPPVDGQVVIGLFKPAAGMPNSTTASAPVPDIALELLASNPPTESIDARQPSNLDGTNPSGWQFVELTFNGYALNSLPADFSVAQEGGPGPAPTILAVLPVTKETVSVVLDRSISTRAWTTITHTISGTSTRLGFLPGDVNGDGTSSPMDILALIDALNGVGQSLPIWSTDIDRSGVATPADILREIDVLNGAGELEVFNGATLP